MFDRFKLHIETNLPFLMGKKLLLANSGGIDSMVLTHLFSKMDVQLHVAHCNFKLRNEASDEDAEFIRKTRYLPTNQVYITVFDTENYAKKHKLSIQLAARALRYQWFDELLKEKELDYILTAHHADDNLETFIINFTRGSGLEGLTGIPQRNGNIVRPLLPFSQEEISKYAKENQIEWREDETNASTKYLRNKIRHEIVPLLKEINPSLLDSFSNTLEFLHQSQSIVDDRMESVSESIVTRKHQNGEEIIEIDIPKLKELSNPKAYLYQILKQFNFRAWNDIYELLDSQSGKQIFSNSHRLIKDREVLLISKIQINSLENIRVEIEEFNNEISSPINLKFDVAERENSVTASEILVDKDLLKYPLFVRKWKNGDYFYPTGMRGKKKVSKFFKDEKFSLLDKEKTWILTNADDEVIWIINKRQDRRFATTKNTKQRLKISCATTSFSE